jgi:hypothetical protein
MLARWMDKWMPGANKGDANYVYAYSVAFLMHQTLKNCGNELTRANVMKQAASFQKLRVPLAAAGITVTPARPTSIRSSRSSSSASRARAGKLFGEVMSAESACPAAPREREGRRIRRPFSFSAYAARDRPRGGERLPGTRGGDAAVPVESQAREVAVRPGP